MWLCRPLANKPVCGPSDPYRMVQESTEYVESIIADVQRLGIEFKAPITYTSDYFPEMLDLAERLIKAGFLYADDTRFEQMREVRPLSHAHPLLQNKPLPDGPEAGEQNSA